MSAVPEELKVDSVLLDTGTLMNAHRRASVAGTRQIGGLYFDNGKRLEDHARTADVKVTSAEVQQEQHLARIARTYNAQQQRRHKRSERAHKTQEQWEDEEVGKKSKAILEKASEHDKVLFNELFDFFDVDKDRTWGTIEFAQRMTDVGCNTSVESAANLLYFAGVRDVDRVTYDDFIQMMPKLKAFRRLLEKDAMRAFADRDVNGTGFLSRHALKEVIYTLAGPEGIDEEIVRHLVKKSDRERTGRIPFPFFIRALFGTPPMLVYTPKPKRKGLLASIFGCGSTGGHYVDSDEEELGPPGF